MPSIDKSNDYSVRIKLKPALLLIKFFQFTLSGNYKNNIKFEKKNYFLGLMKKFRIHEYKPTVLVARRVSPYAVSMKQFKKYYSPLLGITALYEYTDF